MISYLALSVLLATTPSAEGAGEAASAEPVSVLVLDLKASGIEDSQAAVLNDILGQSVARHAMLKVITTADMRRMADVDATKQLVGCDDASCMAQLAGDFGARYVLYGSVAALGELYVIQLTLFDGEKAEAVKRGRVETRNIADVTQRIDAGVDEVFAPILGPKIEPPPPEPVPVGLWITGGGVAVAVVGAVLLGLSAGPAGVYNQAQTDLAAEQSAFEGGDAAALGRAAQLHADADAAAGSYLLLVGSGAALTIVGVGVAATGAVMWLGAE